MKRKIFLFLKDALVYLLVIFISGELSLRFFYVHSDSDGNSLFGSCWLRPYHLPLTQARGFSNWELMKEKYIDYDPILGWVSIPGASSRDSLYRYNAQGMRSISTQDFISILPKPGILRIAIFGDSYTHGDEVVFENTWGYRLQEDLKERGINAEVLNFGVAGYGMDQAFLRWKKDGYRYAPQIVIFGLQVENVTRNVNLMRYMFHPKAAMLFFKPRFILENNRLKLIDSPPPEPKSVFHILQHYDSWEFAKYEYWYDPEKYKDNLWLNSRFIALVLCFLDKAKGELHRNGEDPELLSLKIIQMFKEDVESKRARFFIVYLPNNIDLDAVLKTGHSPSARFLNEVEKIQPMIHPERKLLEAATRGSVRSLFGDLHYSVKANNIVASVVAGSIAKNK